MKYPRVSEVLSPFDEYESIPPQVLDRAAVRGNSVHALCAAIAKGEWIPDGMIKPELLGYVNSFRLWQEAQVEKFVTIEHRYTHSQLHFTGQVDAVIIGTDGNLHLVDLKTTSKPLKKHNVQMAAYQILLRHHDIPTQAALLVYLNKDGHFPEIHFLEDLALEEKTFLGALDCWNYFKKDTTDDKS